VTEKGHGTGKNAAREIEEQVETRTGHPTSRPHDEASAETGETRENLAAEFLGVSPRSHQHARKGQAESPRELNLNQPEKKRDNDR
jgi:hypothetical protein